MIARQLQQMLGQPEKRPETLPWWVGPQTIARVNEVRAEIAAKLYTLSAPSADFRASLRRIGFAGAGTTRSS